MTKSIRKKLALLLSILMIISAVPVASAASETYTEGDFVYEVDGETATVIGYTGDETDVVVPGTFADGVYTVTTVGRDPESCLPFYDNTAITSVVYPDSVTKLSSGSFYGCTSLRTIEIGENITSIESYVFRGCTALETIYFKGTEAQWNSLLENNFNPNGNAELDANVNIVFNYGYDCMEDGHKLENVEYSAPTCYQAGNNPYCLCGVCGYMCNENGEPLSPEDVIIPESHDWIDADCTTPKTCALCGATEGQELGHKDEDDNGYCDVCDELVCEHESENIIIINDYEPTCEEEGYTGDDYCLKCMNIVWEGQAIPAEGHDKAYCEEKAPTCTECGWYAYEYCLICDYTTYDEIPATGHTEQREVYEAPTCTDTGYEGRVICSVCKEVLSQGTIIDPTGHNMELDEDVSYYPTCQSEGYLYYCCTNEGCTEFIEEYLPYGEHTYYQWYVTKSPTCNEPGLQASVCEVCNIPTAAIIDAIGHDYNFENAGPNDDGTHTVYCEICDETTEGHWATFGCEYEDVVKEPTCTEGGYTIHICACCDYSYFDSEVDPAGHEYEDWFSNDDGTHYKICIVCDSLGSMVDGNCTFDEWSVTIAPDCTTDGEKMHTCEKCGYTEYATVEKLGHEDEDGNGYCDREGCEILLCDHSGQDVIIENYEEATCTESGYSGDKYCAKCGVMFEEGQVTDALGHSLWYAPAQKPTCVDIGWNAYEYCDRCDYSTYEVIEALEHDCISVEAEEPTCTQPGHDEYEYCCRCDYSTYEAIEALGHDEIVISGVPATCTEAGISDGLYCVVCEQVTLEQAAVEALGHDFCTDEENSTAVTCTQDGLLCEKCSRCDEAKTTVLKATGHNIKRWVTSEYATCTQEGILIGLCSNCFQKGTQTTEKLPHADENGDKKCDMCGKVLEDSSSTEKPDDNDDTPDDSNTTDCSCYCHTTGIIRFFLFDIPLLFQRFLGINKTCKCGATHY